MGRLGRPHLLLCFSVLVCAWQVVAVICSLMWHSHNQLPAGQLTLTSLPKGSWTDSRTHATSVKLD